MTANLSERKKDILCAVISEYLRTAVPVGSKTIVNDYGFNLSSATIRNEMAALEEEGYLMQPHHSAGRIPSEKGYRCYVDEMMRLKRLSRREESYLEEAYQKHADNIEDVLHRTLHLLSNLSRYTALTFAPKDKVYSHGISNIVSQPEFSEIKKLGRLIEKLEEEKALIDLLRENSEKHKVTIRIGSEITIKEMQSCSLITTTYQIKPDCIGILGVVGPTRMGYGRTSTILNKVAHLLDNFFEEG